MSRSSSAVGGVALVSLALATATVAGAATRGAEAVFRAAREYTVRIQTRIETPFVEDEPGAYSGAGFLVDASRGWILTNAHVVGSCPAEVQVAFAGEPYQPVRKVYVDPFADIAVLALAHADAKRPVARLDRAPLPRVGVPVGAFGHPLGIPFTGTRGIVSGVTDLAGPALIQIDATIDHGNSGGPVISLEDGAVVGIATCGAGGDGHDRLNFATPIADARCILGLLAAGVAPSPPRLPFALVKDEDGCFTLTVGRTHDPARWPFEPGDRILGVDGQPAPLEHLQDLVLALRGRDGEVPLAIERDGARRVITARPEPRALVLDRRGVQIDGALLAPGELDDVAGTDYADRLFVHSVDPSSEAAAKGIEPGDALDAVDGRAFTSVDALLAHLSARPAGPLTMDLLRVSDDRHLLHELHRRVLPGTSVVEIGPNEPPLAGTP